MAHPIESIMGTTMENLREMVDVNTVIGDAVQTPDGTTIIPISKVSFGFVAGGGEYTTIPASPTQNMGVMPFAGGTGAGVSVCPVGFLIAANGQIKMLPAQHDSPVERLIELVPTIIEDMKGLCCKCGEGDEKKGQHKPYEEEPPRVL
ncbi:MAG: GerW family sporulation protein [Christensenellaceae bacterium]|nr:GerW family sporulation protein [Christensenellaceae bacterium]